MTSLRRSRERLLRRWRRRAGGDAGLALITVMGAMVVLSLFLLTSLAVVVNTAPVNRRDQDAKAALAAAEAGMEEYVSRLTSDSNYFNKGNVDATNPALTASGSGQSIPGTGGAAASFRYQLLNTPAQVAQTGQIRLQVTGMSSPGNGGTTVKRTITATIKPQGFLRYVYVSDVEVTDPDLTTPSFTYVTLNGSSFWSSSTTRYRYVGDYDAIKAACGSYYYAGRSSPSYTVSSTTPVKVYDTTAASYTQTITTGGGTVAGFSSLCREIQWTANDVLQGPFHSNDALQINGSTLFTDPVTESSWSNPPNSSQRWWGTGTPSSSGYRPVYGAPLSLPAGNEDLLTYVEPRVDDPSAAPGPGCLYEGATRIVFQGTTMRVLSPSTTNAPSRCLDTSNRANEQTKSIPPVIYVTSTSTACSYRNVGYPISNEDTSGITTDYTCTRGTAYVSGQVSGQVTVAAKDDVVVTANLEVDDPTGTDIVGLIAGNYVWVYHPVNASGTNLLSSSSAVHNIDAAILSLRHSFLVQNWSQGAPISTSTATKLNVTGSIAQKFRGPVGTGNGTAATTGYLKNYVYDSRLLVLQPPYFLKPSSSPWKVSQVSDK